jgi:hypothetical protein
MKEEYWQTRARYAQLDLEIFYYLTGQEGDLKREKAKVSGG